MWQLFASLVLSGIQVIWQHFNQLLRFRSFSFGLGSDCEWGRPGCAENARIRNSASPIYCRERGLYPEQVVHWRQLAHDANEKPSLTMTQQRDLDRRHQQDLREIKKLKQELRRKEKALAEAAALLVLRKKWEAFCSEEEVD
jgi:hypothetical protein